MFGAPENLSKRHNLKLHTFCHTGVKTHACGKQFTQLSNLTTHEHIHTGIKAVKCETCPVQFIWEENLKAH